MDVIIYDREKFKSVSISCFRHKRVRITQLSSPQERCRCLFLILSYSQIIGNMPKKFNRTARKSRMNCEFTAMN